MPGFEHKGEYHLRNVAVFISSAFIVIGIYLPLLFYYLCKFWKMRNAPYLQNRYPMLTILSAISICSVLFFGTWCGFLYVNGLSHSYLLIILFFILCSGSLFAHSVMIRIWLIYFTVRVNKAILNDKWQSIINSNMNIVENPCPADNPNAFYLQNRKTYGNYQFCMKKLKKGLMSDFIALIVIFGILFILYLCRVPDKIVHVLFAVFMILDYLFVFVAPLFVIIYIYRLIPDFYDNMCLREELLMTARMYLISIPCFILVVAGFAIDQFLTVDREGKQSGIGLIYIACDWNVNAFILFFVAITILHRFPNKLAKMYNDANSKRSATTISMMTNTVLSTPTESNDLNRNDTDYTDLPTMDNKNAKHIKIRHVLKHEECFQVFIEHLAYEYCMESLLSIIEITQYRQYILECEPQLKQQFNHQTVFSESITISENPSKSSSNYHKYYELPPDIVKSNIVFPGYYTSTPNTSPCGVKQPTIDEYLKENNVDDEDKSDRIKRYKKMAYSIYDKYVRTGAEYEINLAYAVRMRYIALMNNKHIWMNEMEDFDENELCPLFDDCYDEMVRLMAQSFARFKRTNSKFEKVAAVLRKN